MKRTNPLAPVIHLFSDPYPSSAEEAFKRAGLGWEVQKWKIEAIGPSEPHMVIYPKSLPKEMATVRTDVNRTLGIVGPDYEVIQNHEHLQLMDDLALDGKMRYESGGLLDGGRLVFLQGEILGETEITPNDRIKRHLLMYTTHDGSTRATVRFINYRIT